jgi:hypothetical protein
MIAGWSPAKEGGISVRKKAALNNCVGRVASFVHDRGVEQLVARRAHNPKVAGSSPAPATRCTYNFFCRYSFFI